MRLGAWPARGAAALAGALMVLGFAPFGWPGAVLPAPTFSLALLLWLQQRHATSPGAATALGYAFGLGFFLAGVSWVFVSMSEFSAMPGWAAALATLAFCAYLALYPAIAVGLYARWRRGDGGLKDALLFAGLWTLGEWLRGTLFSGFPWLAIGYAYTTPSPLGGYASTLGVYGVGFAAALLAAWLAQLAQAGRLARALRLALIVGVSAIGYLLGAMPWTAPLGAPLRVALLQGDIPQSEKWDPDLLMKSFERYYALIENHRGSQPQLTVLPETAVPFLFEQLPIELVERFAATGDVVLGAASSLGPQQYINAAIALPQRLTGEAQMYAKHHLVPFGEFAPPGFRWFFDLLRLPMADFTAGPLEQPPLSIGGAKVAANICYEDLFGEQILLGARQADLLVNLSNTAWFGRSLAQPQHLQIAQMRAMETGRPMLRATNSGMTAHIDAQGRVLAYLAPFTSGRLDTEVQRTSGLTPFVKWGNALALLLAALAILIGRRKAGL